MDTVQIVIGLIVLIAVAGVSAVVGLVRPGRRRSRLDADAAGELAADSDSAGVPHPPPGVLGDRFVAGVDVDPRPWK